MDKTKKEWESKLISLINDKLSQKYEGLTVHINAARSMEDEASADG